MISEKVRAVPTISPPSKIISIPNKKEVLAVFTYFLAKRGRIFLGTNKEAYFGKELTRVRFT